MKTLRGRANLLLVAAAWTFYVWITRMWNIVGDAAHSTGFKVVHGVLAAISIGFGVAIARLGIRMRREAQDVAGIPERAASGRR